MRRVLHDCGAGAVIAKGMVGGAFAAVDHRAGLGESVSVVYPEGYTTHDAGVRVLAVRQIDVNTPETPDLDRKAHKVDTASGLQKFRVSVGPRSIPRHPARSPGDLKVEADNGSLGNHCRGSPAA